MSNIPEAFIAINNNRLSHSKPMGKNGADVVYLSGDTEFQIELFNPLQDRIKASILVNGRSIGSDLILRPGERFYLDRFMDKNDKLLFETYEVENTDQALSAIRKNGLVQVRFYRESSSYIYHSASAPSYTIAYSGTSIYWHTTSDSTGIIPGAPSTHTVSYSSDTLSTPSKSLLTSSPSNADYNPSTTETGRVERGTKSDQKFTTTSGNFQTFVNEVTIQMLPQSRMTTEIKTYCSVCGRRFRKADNFCPKCGEKK